MYDTTFSTEELDVLSDNVVITKEKPIERKYLFYDDILRRNEVTVLRIDSNASIEKKIEYLGESFIVEKMDDLIIIRHPSWSLMGKGEKLLEAERDLINEAKVIFNHYSKLSISSLTKEAICLRDFLYNFIAFYGSKRSD